MDFRSGLDGRQRICHHKSFRQWVQNLGTNARVDYRPYLHPMTAGPKPSGPLWLTIKRGLTMICPTLLDCLSATETGASANGLLVMGHDGDSAAKMTGGSAYKTDSRRD